MWNKFHTEDLQLLGAIFKILSPGIFVPMMRRFWSTCSTRAVDSFVNNTLYDSAV